MDLQLLSIELDVIMLMVIWTIIMLIPPNDDL
jgi:hypothetical protein